MLENALLRYTPPGGFNDPFEGRPEITELSTDERATNVFTSIIPEETRIIYESLPEAVKAMVSFEQVLALSSQLFESKKSEILQELKNHTPSVRAWFYQKFDEQIGALCLSEVPDSILMWSHYASSHTGFVLEFDAHHPHFAEQRSEDDEFRHLRRVFYRDARPSAPLSEMEGVEFFLVKSAHWSYEREWRILRALVEADSVVPSEPFPINLFSFPREAVRGVILGARSTETTEGSVRRVLQAHESYRSTILYRAVPSESHFLLHIKRAPA